MLRPLPALLLLLAACKPGGAAPAGLRVVSLHDVTTELVLELGAGAQLVGIDEPTDAAPGTLEAVAKVPRVAGLESILAVHPTVVLGLGVVQERDPELVTRLRARGIDVYLPDPEGLGDVLVMAEEVGRRVQRVAISERLRRLRTEVDAPLPLPGARVFVYDCCDPPFTAGGKTVLNDLIRRAGGVNVFAELSADWTHVSWEEAVARRPEHVVVHAYRYQGQGDAAQKERALRRFPALAKVPVTVIPLGWSLGGLRSLEALGVLREALAPVAGDLRAAPLTPAAEREVGEERGHSRAQGSSR
jgi:iron complex transport system substrate-binding protein